MIQVSPLPTMSCMEEYAKLLLSIFVRPLFRTGAIEVHVVFDSPGTQKEFPKEIKQYKRDQNTKDSVWDHNCTDFSSDLLIPEKWRSVLGCRVCKKNQTHYLAEDILRLIPHTLQPHQQLITNVGSKVYGCTREKKIPKEDLVNVAEEADLRVWLHCKKSAGVNNVIFSPDTDIYNIGLSLILRVMSLFS